MSEFGCVNMTGVGWHGEGTLTLTDGTTYTGEFLADGEKTEEESRAESGHMHVLFRGKCVLPNQVIREGRFHLVDPIMRMELCGEFGEGIQREHWETELDSGCHNLGFEIGRTMELASP